MLVVLAEATDPVAAAVADGARARGHEVHRLTPATLVAASWRHHLEDDEVTTRLALPDGRVCALGEATGVLNRLRRLPPGGLASAEDRDYARAERHALVTSALSALTCPVVNPVQPPALAGAERSAVSWLALAAPLAPTRRVRLTTDGRRWAAPDPGWEALDWPALTEVAVPAAPLHPSVPGDRRPVAWTEPVGPVHAVTVVGGRAHGAPDAGWAGRCRRLAEAAGCPLLDVALARRGGDGDWVVVGADPMPPSLSPGALGDLVALVAP